MKISAERSLVRNYVFYGYGRPVSRRRVRTYAQHPRLIHRRDLRKVPLSAQDDALYAGRRELSKQERAYCWRFNPRAAER
jgi:hypothetical protein